MFIHNVSQPNDRNVICSMRDIKLDGPITVDIVCGHPRYKGLFKILCFNECGVIIVTVIFNGG